MRNPKLTIPLFNRALLILLVLGSLDAARAAVSVTANVSQGPMEDTITLTNSSTNGEAVTQIWFAYALGPQDYMATMPTNVKAPAGWTATVTNAGSSDGYGIKFTTTTSPLAASASLTGFSFHVGSPLEGNSTIAAYAAIPVTTSQISTANPVAQSNLVATLSYVTGASGVMSIPLVSGTTTYLTLPLTEAPIYSDAVASFSSSGLAQPSAAIDTIAVTNATAFTVTSNGTTTVEPLELPTSDVPYFVRFLTGAEAGRILLVKSNTATTLTLDLTDHTLTPLTQSTALQNSPATAFDVQAGDTFEVFQGQTLASLFGSGTTQDPLVGLSGGANVGSADTVAFPSTLGAPVTTFFFSTKVGVNTWTKYPSTANANTQIVYPYSPMEITRNAATNTTLALTGSVTSVPIMLKTLSSTTAFSASPYAAGIALSALKLGAGWQKGTSVGNSDNLNVWNAGNGVQVGHFDVYYQLSSNSTWRKYPDRNTDVSSFVLLPTTVIQIAKQNNVTGATSFLLPSLPY